MPRKSKYLGKIYDGRWEIIELEYHENSHRIYYIARNIFNKRIIKIDDVQISLIEKGKIDVGCVIRRKMYKERRFNAQTIVF